MKLTLWDSCVDREADGDGEAEVRETESEEAILNKK